jgi:hypothetical protein
MAQINAQQLLNGPETVVYDSLNDRYLVSNMNQPYNIVSIDHVGNYTAFISDAGLVSPHGMTISGNTLYIATSMGGEGGVVGFDLTTGEQVFEALSPSWFFAANGIAVDTSGYLYFSLWPATMAKVRLSDGESTVMAGGFSSVNGLHFDARNNRLLIADEVFNSQIFGMDIGPDSFYTIPFENARFAGITEDQMHNIYISAFNDREIYRADSALSLPAELLFEGLRGVEGICFDRVHSILAAPLLLNDSVFFVPLDIDLWCETDTLVGWAPFEVAFTGGAIFEIASWDWDFGDGSSGQGQSITHSYDSPGLYDVAMEAVSLSGDTLRRVYPRHIFALADTLWADHVTVDPEVSSDVEVVIGARNFVPVREFALTIEYGGELELIFDSISAVGCRSETYPVVNVFDVDSVARRLSAVLRPYLADARTYEMPGNGPIVKAYFHVTQSAYFEQSSAVLVAGYSPETSPRFTANGAVYEPIPVAGSVTYPDCCTETRGDLNRDGDDANIIDLTFIVDYIFRSSGDPGFCPHERDVNADGSELPNILDLTFLVDRVFRSGPLPPACP